MRKDITEKLNEIILRNQLDQSYPQYQKEQRLVRHLRETVKEILDAEAAYEWKDFFCTRGIETMYISAMLKKTEEVIEQHGFEFIYLTTDGLPASMEAQLECNFWRMPIN